MSIPQYIPPIIWKLWQSYGYRTRGAVASTSTYHVYGYDVYSGELFETFPEIVDQKTQSIFQDFDVPSFLYPAVRAFLHEAEKAFCSLETRTEAIITHIADTISSSTLTSPKVILDREAFLTIIKFFTFVRFRNSAHYRKVVETLMQPGVTLRKNSRIERIKPACNAFIQQLRYQALFQTFTRFFNADTSTIQSRLQSKMLATRPPSSLPIFRTRILTEPQQIREDPWIEDFNFHCWEFCRKAEVYLGVASEADQEYILPDTCFGTLDESFGGGAGGEERDPKTESLDSFFPILPTVSVYILRGEKTWICSQCQGSIVIDVTEELALDVHLRNAMVLSTVPYFRNRITQRFRSFNTPPITPLFHSPALKPVCTEYFDEYIDSHYVCGPKIYFSSLLSITESISSYDEFRCRWIADTFVDYTRLKQRCRQKFEKEGVLKMLNVKGNLRIHDLTDEVELISSTALCCGGFSDVWKGEWFDPVEKKKRTVAIKYLRQVMFQDAREEFLKRLHAEVITWHQLAHRNLASLYGLVQSPTSIGMVSLWCDNGTICRYVRDNPPIAKLDLLIQIASGVSYLHDLIPPVVHGDLKAGNILVDSQGQAIITDFGLSKVMSEHLSSTGTRKPTSFFAGSTRWMAPELVHAQAEDKKIHVTTYSDVYAYGAVFLEVITGQLPYPHRSSDFLVILDIIQGVRPYQRSMVSAQMSALSLRGSAGSTSSVDVIWSVVESCWDPLPVVRPKMKDVVKLLVDLQVPPRCQV